MSNKFAVMDDDRFVFLCNKFDFAKLCDAMDITYLRNLMIDIRVIPFYNDEQRDNIIAGCKKIGMPVVLRENVFIKMRSG